MRVVSQSGDSGIVDWIALHQPRCIAMQTARLRKIVSNLISPCACSVETVES